MSTEDHLAGPALAAAGGAAVGKVVIVRTGMTAAGMVGSGTGFGMAAGPFGLLFGALGGLAVYAVLRAVGDIAQEQAAVQEWLAAERVAAVAQAEEWAEDWAEEAIEVTGDHEADKVRVADVVASFDAWLEEMFSDQRPPGWAIETSRMAVLRFLKLDPTLTPERWLAGVRLRAVS
jgi:hypothetical protein